MMQRILGLVLGVLMMPGAALAGQCGYELCWGAVAVGNNGAWGTAYGQYSESAAVNRAQSGCQGNCNIVRAFYNSCAAIAMADNGGWGWATEKNRELAESSAMNYCMDYGRNCRVKVWSCSP